MKLTFIELLTILQLVTIRNVALMAAISNHKQ